MLLLKFKSKFNKIKKKKKPSLPLATWKVLNCYTWLMAAALDRTEYRHHELEFCWAAPL